MASVVRVSPDLSSWLTDSLRQGRSPSSLAQTMVAEGMALRIARAVVDAFVVAIQTSSSQPLDTLIVEDEPPAYVYEAPIVAPRPRFVVDGRVIPVLARVERPAVSVLGSVFSEEECAALIQLARFRLAPSTMVNPYSGQDEVAAQRTSQGMFFRLEENSLVARLDRRVSELMGLPLENGEGFQVLRYLPGTEATPHFDFLTPSNPANRASIARSGQRVSTLITYLNEVEAGGETAFPSLGFSVLPARGNAVYFEYSNSQGQVDPASLHAGKLVTRGEKWVATKWMRQRRFIPAS